MVETDTGRARGLLALLTLAAAVGAADVAWFAATQPGVALQNPSRAAGTLTGLAIWLALTGTAGARVVGVDDARAKRATLALAALAALDGVGLAAIHVAVHAAGWETYLGAGAGAAALALAVAARK